MRLWLLYLPHLRRRHSGWADQGSDSCYSSLVRLLYDPMSWLEPLFHRERFRCITVGRRERKVSVWDFLTSGQNTSQTASGDSNLPRILLLCSYSFFRHQSAFWFAEAHEGTQCNEVESGDLSAWWWIVFLRMRSRCLDPSTSFFNVQMQITC